MSEWSFEVGAQVWWLHQYSERYGFTADVPAVVTRAEDGILAIQVANLNGRSLWLRVTPDSLRMRIGP